MANVSNTEREEIEEIVKEELIKNPSSPGIYYPFKPPIKKDSALGKLLTSKGVRECEFVVLNSVLYSVRFALCPPHRNHWDMVCKREKCHLFQQR